MFSLCTERNEYLRIRKGVTREEVIKTFSVPVGEVFCGKIIRMTPPKRFCYARPFDGYAEIAAREGVDEGELRRINGDGALYPTKKVWLP